MYQIRVQPEGSRLQLTFKQVSHLKAYDRKLAKSAQQQHTAALGQLAFQLPASPAAAAAGQSSRAEQQQQQQQQDGMSLAEAGLLLLQILTESMQH
jgi:hypothetical protein